MENRLIRHGFILILLSLFTGFAIPAAEAPRLALSAHTIGLMTGILLLAIAGIWSRLALSEGQLKVTYWGWIYASYANWLGILLGALTGAGRMTPLASKGVTGSDASELLVAFFLISLSLAALVSTALSIYGITRKA